MLPSKTILRNCSNYKKEIRNQLIKHKIVVSHYATTTTCPHILEATSDTAHEQFLNARPYSDVPGPKPIPLLGNTWR